MSVAHRLYWNLVDMGLESEFCRWLRDTYPILFKEYNKQFQKKKELSKRPVGDLFPSARSKD